jgi:hypothetical protein
MNRSLSASGHNVTQNYVESKQNVLHCDTAKLFITLRFRNGVKHVLELYYVTVISLFMTEIRGRAVFKLAVCTVRYIAVIPNRGSVVPWGTANTP